MTGVSDGPLERLRQAVERTRVVTHGRPSVGRTHDDADDRLGTIATDSARGFDPFPLLRALHEAGARVAVIGQVAGIMHGSRELTGDLKRVIDVMHQFLSFPAFDITSMLLGSGQGGGATG